MKYSPSLCRCEKNNWCLTKSVLSNIHRKYLGEKKRLPNRLNSNQNSETMIKLHPFHGNTQSAKTVKTVSIWVNLSCIVFTENYKLQINAWDYTFYNSVYISEM